jgi:hypothetical protein
MTFHPSRVCLQAGIEQAKLSLDYIGCMPGLVMCIPIKNAIYGVRLSGKCSVGPILGPCTLYVLLQLAYNKNMTAAVSMAYTFLAPFRLPEISGHHSQRRANTIHYKNPRVLLSESRCSLPTGRGSNGARFTSFK